MKTAVAAVLIVVVVVVVVVLGRTTSTTPPVYAVSLRRKVDRRARLRSRVPGVHFVDAVDGRDLRSGGSLTRGELACFYSHVKAWRLAAKSADFSLVLEDDADVRLPDAMPTIHELVAACPADWDILFLGLNYPPRDAERVGRVGRWSVRRVAGDTYGLHAVVLRGSGARKLLRAWERYGVGDPGGGGGDACPVDVWVSRLPGVKAYWVDPALVKPWDIDDSETQRIR